MRVEIEGDVEGGVCEGRGYTIWLEIEGAALL
jgi:hypothetical protein